MELQKEFWAPDFCLAQSCLLWEFMEWIGKYRSVYCSTLQVDENKKIKGFFLFEIEFKKYYPMNVQKFA